MSTDARTLMAQHAKTTQLLGVDFLPLGSPLTNLKGQTSAQLETKPAHSAATPTEPSLGSAPVPELAEPNPMAQIPAVTLADLQSHTDAIADHQPKLDALRQRYELDAPHQHFNNGFKSIVFGEGAADADLMFVGEAPGEQEDITGRPFVGRAGQLLEKMIVAMGYSRESVYICNVLKTRPPNNATPTSEEARLCAPYLLEQIRIIEPKVIVTLGLPASQLLLGSTSPMRSMRGHWHDFPPKVDSAGIIADQDLGAFPKIEVMPTYHPAYLLRSYTEENRRKVWSDLQMVIERLSR